MFFFWQKPRAFKWILVDFFPSILSLALLCKQHPVTEQAAQRHFSDAGFTDCGKYQTDSLREWIPLSPVKRYILSNSTANNATLYQQNVTILTWQAALLYSFLVKSALLLSLPIWLLLDFFWCGHLSIKKLGWNHQLISEWSRISHQIEASSICYQPEQVSNWKSTNKMVWQLPKMSSPRVKKNNLKYLHIRWLRAIS